MVSTKLYENQQVIQEEGIRYQRNPKSNKHRSSWKISITSRALSGYGNNQIIRQKQFTQQPNRRQTQFEHRTKVNYQRKIFTIGSYFI